MMIPRYTVANDPLPIFLMIRYLSKE